MNFPLRIIGWLIVASVSTSSASNILGMFLTHSPSHVIIHMAIVRALVERGHNVTVITSLPLKEPNPGYRHIFLKELEISKDEMDAIIEGMRHMPLYVRLPKMLLTVQKFIEKYSNFMSDPAFVSFLEEDNHFDLLLLGYVFNDFQLGVADHFKCPTVLSWIIQPIGEVSRIIGNPVSSSFVPPVPFMEPSAMTFSGRVGSFIFSIVDRTLLTGFRFYLERLYNNNFPPSKYPSMTEMRQNVSLILSNSHFSEGPVRPLVPGLVEIGGIQIKDQPDPLPEDINKLLDNSPQGAIFFSLGSNAREEHLGPNVLKIIYKVFASLPYNVLWKFDDANVPGNTSNILFKKWLPQDDILAHKNLRLFITHAGKGSITESEYHGVPMVAIPLFGDQLSNAETTQKKGHGVVLDYHTLTEVSFRNAVIDVMESDTYRSAVQGFSKIFRDRPLTARQNAVFWIEYVIRHRGAPHMQSPLKSMNIWQENSVDVILFLAAVVYVAVKLVKVLFKLSVLGLKSARNVLKAKNKVD